MTTSFKTILMVLTILCASVLVIVQYYISTTLLPVLPLALVCCKW
jgi:hypothetical protein